MLHREDKTFIYKGKDFYDILQKLVSLLSVPDMCLYIEMFLSEPEATDMHGNYNKHHSSTFYTMESNNKVIIKIYISKGCCGDMDHDMGEVEISISYLSDINQNVYFNFLSRFLHLKFEEQTLGGN